MTPQQLFDENKGLVYHVAFRHKYPSEAEEDMIQEGMLALWRAAQGFDDAKGLAFSTYAGTAIAHAYDAFLQQVWNSSGLSVCSDTRRRAVNAKFNDGKMNPGYDRLFETALSTDYKLHHDSDEDGATIGETLGYDDEYPDLIQSDMRSVVSAAIEHLSPADQELLRLRFGFGCEPMSYVQLGAEIGASDTTARKRVLEALDRLASYLPSSARQLLG